MSFFLGIDWKKARVGIGLVHPVFSSSFYPVLGTFQHFCLSAHLNPA